MQPTSPPSFVVRAFLIFSFLFSLFFVVLVGAIYTGAKSGEIKRKIVEPLTNSYANLIKQINTPNTPTFNTIEPTQKPTETPVPSVAPTKTQNIYYVYPTATPYPTIVPGQPGSKEWEEEFQKKWNEMSTKNSQMQQQVEDSQKKFCQEHADLCK